MHVQKLMHAASTLCNTIVHYFYSMIAVPTCTTSSKQLEKCSQMSLSYVMRAFLIVVQKKSLRPTP